MTSITNTGFKGWLERPQSSGVGYSRRFLIYLGVFCASEAVVLILAMTFSQIYIAMMASIVLLAGVRGAFAYWNFGNYRGAFESERSLEPGPETFFKR